MDHLLLEISFDQLRCKSERLHWGGVLVMYISCIQLHVHVIQLWFLRCSLVQLAQIEKCISETLLHQAKQSSNVFLGGMSTSRRLMAILCSPSGACSRGSHIDRFSSLVCSLTSGLLQRHPHFQKTQKMQLWESNRRCVPHLSRGVCHRCFQQFILLLVFHVFSDLSAWFHHGLNQDWAADALGRQTAESSTS